MEKKNEPLIDLLQIMDDFKSSVELFTGFKNQFIAEGWDPYNAELMVVEIFKSANKAKE